MDKETYYKLQEEEAGEFYGGWADQMVSALLELIKENPTAKTIIDIGCHEGRGLFEVEKLYPDKVIVGIDLIKSKIQKARKQGFLAFEMDMHDLSFFNTNSFDLSFCSHAIEHSLDPSIVLKEIIRVSRAGLIICPIELGGKSNGPHTSCFSTKEQWTSLWENEIYNSTLEVSHEEKNRISYEIWSKFKKK